MKQSEIPSGYPYPSPSRAKDQGPSYDRLCDDWASSLSEVNLRALASDYMRGIIDESTEDAYNEFRLREKLGLLAEQRAQDKSPKRSKSRAR